MRAPGGFPAIWLSGFLAFGLTVAAAPATRAQTTTTFFPPAAANTDQCKTPTLFDLGLFGAPLSALLVAGGLPDKACQRFKSARMLAELGYREAAAQMLCQDRDVARAMAAAGTPCDRQVAALKP